MAGTYSLTFLGFSSETAEALQKFKTICVADLELTVEKTQELLASDALTKVLITSDSLPEITRISHLLTNVGAQVAIVSTSQELPPEVEEQGAGEEVELTFDLEDLLGETPQKTKENKAPKEYHLDLENTDDLATLGFTDDTALESLPSPASPEHTENNNLPSSVPMTNQVGSGTKSTETPSEIESLSFNEDTLSPSAHSVDPISQLVSDVAHASSSKLASSWSDDDLALQLGAPVEELLTSEESSTVTSDPDFEDLTVLPAPLPKEMLSGRSARTIERSEPKDSPASSASTSAHSTLMNEIASAVDLAFDSNDINEVVPPTLESPPPAPSREAQITESPIVAKSPSSQSAPQKINLAAALDSISFEKLLDDDPPPFGAVPSVPPALSAPQASAVTPVSSPHHTIVDESSKKLAPSGSSSPEKLQAGVVDPEKRTTENPSTIKNSSVDTGQRPPQDTATQGTTPLGASPLGVSPVGVSPVGVSPLGAATHKAEDPGNTLSGTPQQNSIADDALYVSGAKTKSDYHRDGFSKGQLVGIFLAGVAILVAGNWMLTPEQEETSVPSLEQVVTSTKTDGSPTSDKGASKTTAAPPAERNGPLSSSLAGILSGEGFEITVTSNPQGNTLSTKVLLTTPKPAELSLEEIANNTPHRIWLKRAESDVVQLKQVGANEWSGSAPTYIFVERGAERRRLPGVAMISGQVAADGSASELRVEITYTPPGDTALPAPGSIIEAAGKDLYRVSVSAVVPVKKK